MTLSSGIEVPTESIAEICRRYHARELSVFGSAARGEMRLGRKVDLVSKRGLKPRVRPLVLRDAVAVYAA